MEQIRKTSRTIAFQSEAVPDYGVAQKIAAGVLRVVARNPGVMTYHGTNTYLVEENGGWLVVDPGPDLTDHLQAILVATGRHISAILVSHGHQDHCGAAMMLREESGAPIHASALPPVAATIEPDEALGDGGRIGRLTALATPGHTRDHVCFVDEAEGLFFSADHVMTWSSSIVSPTQGNMADYMASLRATIERNDPVLLPGHGPRLDNPAPYCQSLLDLRLRREASVLEALADGPKTLHALARRIYPHQTHEKSIWAAEQNLVAHLYKLAAENRAVALSDGCWQLAY